MNFEAALKGLYYFDCMMTGKTELKKLELTKSDIKIIKSLVKWKIDDNVDDAQTRVFDEYIYEMFDSFCRNKKKIVWDLDTLMNAPDELRGLIFKVIKMHKIDGGMKIADIAEAVGSIEKNGYNLFRNKIVRLFPNANDVVILTGNAYPLSLKLLMNKVIKTSWKQITIKASSTSGNSNSWLNGYWEVNRMQIQKEFSPKGFKVSMEYLYNSRWWNQYWLIIKRT